MHVVSPRQDEARTEQRIAEIDNGTANLQEHELIEEEGVSMCLKAEEYIERVASPKSD